ncbi:hypothetical protein BOVA604_4092 [Bacteroides ovatus]|jgi:hypothetical protein|uniref:hypothetical protein n=1 Tax=Bacteroides TaxID=816 RepID=UPI001F1E54E2|nr:MULTISPECIES: hypothetical protein [Bacteroides]MCS3176110.1 hypothetical protein [Candidatus Bacteroides intestinigallinarum]CAG9900353.1 hypothetical protein BOVA604_4092 [Bacteroides ovatus]
MTKLQKLYSTIQNLKELGLELGNDLLKQTSELEQEIIKKEILPVVSEKIEPIINQIQRELVLVVDYVPNEPLSVRISRKRNFTEQMETIEIIPDPKIEHNIGTIKRNSPSKSAKTNLRVTLPNGKVIENRFAYETLQEVVVLAGVEKVRTLGIVQCGVPLVSNTQDNFYNQKEIGKGLYLITHSSTGQKRQQIEKISEAFGLNLKVEIV